MTRRIWGWEQACNSRTPLNTVATCRTSSREADGGDVCLAQMLCIAFKTCLVCGRSERQPVKTAHCCCTLRPHTDAARC